MKRIWYQIVIEALTIMLLISAVSCVNKEYQVTETYYETEYQTTYVEEPYTVDKIYYVPRSIELRRDQPWWYQAGGELSIDLSNKKNSYLSGTIGFEEDYAWRNGWCVLMVFDFENYLLYEVGSSSYKPLTRIEVSQPKLQPTGMTPALLKEWACPTPNTGKYYIVLEGNYWQQFVPFVFSANWNYEEAITQQVTEYREVPVVTPVQVEKQRVVTKSKKVPIWELVFGE